MDSSKDVDVAVVVRDETPEAPHTGRSSWWMAAFHILTVFLGPGILSMPYIMSRLGWIGGLTGLVLFFCLTLTTSSMLADVYQVDGKRHGRYDTAVRSVLSKRHGLFLVISQQVNLVLANIGFQIAAADACSTIAATICRANGALASQCWNKQPVLTVMIGVAQLLLSQMKNLQAARATSAVGGAAAVVYCAIMFALAGSRAGNRQGSLTGYTAEDEPTGAKVYAALNALGAIGFGLNAPIITLEVADTLKQPPAAAVSMQKSLRLGLGSCFVLFGSGAVLSYLALGNTVGRSFLLAFEGTAPAWVLVLGSLMVVLNMVSAYQVCCQPAFAAVEDSLLRRQCCSCAGKSASPASSGQNRTPLWAVSLVFRCAYVGLTTLVAVALPFFAIMVGLAAALTFYQTAVLYPLLLHKAVYPRERLGTLLLNVVLVLAAAVTGLVVVGSVAIIAVSASSLSPLKAL